MTRIMGSIFAIATVGAARLRAALIERGGLAFLTAIAALVGAGLLASQQASAAGCGGCGPSEAGREHAVQAGPHAGHGQAMAAPDAGGPGTRAPATVVSVLEHYAKIHAALATDTTEGVRAAAEGIAKAIASDPDKTLPAEVSTQAESVAKAQDIAAAREAFKLLSRSLSQYLMTQKVQTGRHYQMYCSMANGGWIQSEQDVKNPYYGKSMLACGEIVANY